MPDSDPGGGLVSSKRQDSGFLVCEFRQIGPDFVFVPALLAFICRTFRSFRAHLNILIFRRCLYTLYGSKSELSQLSHRVPLPHTNGVLNRQGQGPYLKFDPSRRKTPRYLGACPITLFHLCTWDIRPISLCIICRLARRPDKLT